MMSIENIGGSTEEAQNQGILPAPMRSGANNNSPLSFERIRLPLENVGTMLFTSNKGICNFQFTFCNSPAK
jgi:hypothetical protein